MDALTLLRQDHQEVQELFKRFENSSDQREKQRIAQRALMELDVHAKIEEEIFYPSLRQMNRGESETSELMNEAEEEHHVAEMLIDELRAMREVNDRYEAKFKVLAESVKHHIQEEESEMLPKAAEAGRERLEELGLEMEERKMELMEQMESGRMVRRPAKRAPARSTAGTRSRASTAASRGGRASAGSRTRTTSANGRRSTSKTARKATGRSTTASRGASSRSTTKSASGSRGASSRSGARSANGRSARTTRTTRSTNSTRSRSTTSRARSTGAAGGSRAGTSKRTASRSR